MSVDSTIVVVDTTPVERVLVDALAKLRGAGRVRVPRLPVSLSKSAALLGERGETHLEHAWRCPPELPPWAACLGNPAGETPEIDHGGDDPSVGEVPR